MQKNSDSLFEILHLNIFSTSIIQEKNTNIIIQMFIKTLISLEKFKIVFLGLLLMKIDIFFF